MTIPFSFLGLYPACPEKNPTSIFTYQTSAFSPYVPFPIGASTLNKEESLRVFWFLKSLEIRVTLSYGTLDGVATASSNTIFEFPEEPYQRVCILPFEFKPILLDGEERLYFELGLLFPDLENQDFTADAAGLFLTTFDGDMSYTIDGDLYEDVTLPVTLINENVGASYNLYVKFIVRSNQITINSYNLIGAQIIDSEFYEYP